MFFIIKLLAVIPSNCLVLPHIPGALFFWFPPHSSLCSSLDGPSASSLSCEVTDGPARDIPPVTTILAPSTSIHAAPPHTTPIPLKAPVRSTFSLRAVNTLTLIIQNLRLTVPTFRSSLSLVLLLCLLAVGVFTCCFVCLLVFFFFFYQIPDLCGTAETDIPSFYAWNWPAFLFQAVSEGAESQVELVGFCRCWDHPRAPVASPGPVGSRSQVGAAPWHLSAFLPFLGGRRPCHSVFPPLGSRPACPPPHPEPRPSSAPPSPEQEPTVLLPTEPQGYTDPVPAGRPDTQTISRRTEPHSHPPQWRRSAASIW